MEKILELNRVARLCAHLAAESDDPELIVALEKIGRELRVSALRRRQTMSPKAEASNKGVQAPAKGWPEPLLVRKVRR